MRLFRPGLVGQMLYPEAIFRVKTSEKLIYLTFDDGPDPDSTPQLIRMLKKYDIKALFFCNGRLAELHPALIEIIKTDGHIIGNHGYNHLNGWDTQVEDYIADIDKAAVFTSSMLFRPPYGHLTFEQYRKLKTRYQIFFWDTMPYDFDQGFGSYRSLNVLKHKIRSGSVIVLHDNKNSTSPEFIEDYLQFVHDEGFKFDVYED